MRRKKSKIVLGSANFSSPYGICPRPKNSQVSDFCRTIIKKSYEFGIFSLDTAASYGDAESVIGKVLLEDQTRSFKENFCIISKAPRGSTSRTLKSSVQNSLRHLQVSKLYGYLLHHFDDFKKEPNLIDAMADLIGAGCIEKFGFSLYYPEELEFLLDKEVPFSMIQLPCSILDQRFISYISELESRGVEVHCRSAFLQGALFMDPNFLPHYLHGLRDTLTKIRQFSVEKDVSLHALALQYLMNLSPSIRIVVGVNSWEELSANAVIVDNPQRDIFSEVVLSDFAIRDERLIVPSSWKIL